MKTIPFSKFTAYGNNFVIVDEATAAVLSEQEKQSFAYQATDAFFGIGSDNLLVIQPYRPEVLADINRANGYWQTPPVQAESEVEFIFRMFEPDGSEALCCGNGLMCIASYLYQHHGIAQARIMTEIPMAQPNVLTIGFDAESQLAWADMGAPRQTPAELVTRDSVTACGDTMLDRVDDLQIEFRSHDLSPITEATSLSLAGYLAFTGEPHLVVFLDSDVSLPEIASPIFAPRANINQQTALKQMEKRATFGTWLVDHIGNYVNKYYQERFPAGISVNFVLLDQENDQVLYRCFERGIYRETLACGTGALAVAYSVQQLRLPDKKSIIVRPHRCNWYQPDACIWAEQNTLGETGAWSLKSKPQKLLDGEFHNARFNGERRDVVSNADLSDAVEELVA